jgi:nucleotide-binding universal stress UspA family protein
MSEPAALLAVLILWPLIGLGLALVLRGRGHDPFGWLVLGMLLGPLAVAFAFDSVANEQGDLVEVRAPTPGHGEGLLDVVVGFDGSPESHAAVSCAERILGDRIGRFTLATVVPFDAGQADERQARAALLEEAAALPAAGFGLEVAHGRPAKALQELVEQEGYDLLVVGTSEREPRDLMGDAARDLATGSTVPVLLVPPEQERTNVDDHE